MPENALAYSESWLHKIKILSPEKPHEYFHELEFLSP